MFKMPTLRNVAIRKVLARRDSLLQRSIAATSMRKPCSTAELATVRPRCRIGTSRI
jgi:hypothetical protein